METVQPQQLGAKKLIKNENLFYIALFLNVLITVMNTTMFNIAIPTISSHFQLSATLASWIVTCYSVVFAIGTVLYGRLSGIYPIKRLLTIGLCLLGIGSVIGMVANAYYLLLIARLLQAAGACSISALGMIMVTRYIPAEQKGAAMGKIAAASTLGFGLGPLFGGLLTEYFGWMFLFAISLLGVLMIPIYRLNIPEESTKRDHFDVFGLIYLCLGAISLLLFITTENVGFIFGILSILLFWRHINRVDHPFIAPALLKTKPYVTILMIGFLVFFINFSVLFISPLLLATIHAVTVAKIGLLIFPGAICSALISILLGKALDSIGVVTIIGSGITSILIGAFLFSSFSYLSEWTILFFYLLSSLGFACITMGLPNFLSSFLPQEDFPSGFGILQLLQFFGGATGVSVSGKILDMSATNTIAVNLFWNDTDASFSNAYLLLVLLAIIALFVFAYFKHVKVGGIANER
ncbi:MFS transporter [Desertibacillus haloalkaliphilus]|uniref:MFS transporter n=1 Tax=Desertibacillus haloalkaliphilus TaxID=1328930 RepID=UPI001C26A5A5|nr:MFS transporter [Desertibacillus haloalkaliphilus]MBU8906099.1 MFS transporter [Desertibacillus haloalkaliphilus]